MFYNFEININDINFAEQLTILQECNVMPADMVRSPSDVSVLKR